MTSFPPLWAAGIADLAPFIIVVVIFIITTVGKLITKVGQQRPPGAQRQPVRPGGIPVARPVDEDERGGIDEFLHRAAGRGQGQPPSRQPPSRQPPDPQQSGPIPHDLDGHEIGGCAIKQRIGAGGMAEVYEARHLKRKSRVAVKVHRLRSPKSVERFLREAKIAVKMTHPNIVRAFDFGHDQNFDLHYIVMEFVDGQDVLRLLTRRGRFGVGEALSIATQVCSALAAAHAAGIVHRDVKPSNILVDRSDAVKLADLGLAKDLAARVSAVRSAGSAGVSSAQDPGLTQAGDVMGTFHYMSPEQAADSGNVDQRSDIYSLGCTFYHMLCGRPPFTGITPQEILQKHAREDRPDARAADSRVSEELASVIQRMMAVRPHDRYRTTTELFDALAGLADGKASGGPVGMLRPLDLATLLGSAGNIRHAIVASEVLNRPEHRWTPAPGAKG